MLARIAARRRFRNLDKRGGRSGPNSSAVFDVDLLEHAGNERWFLALE